MKNRAVRQRIKEIVQMARIPYTIVGRVAHVVSCGEAVSLNVPVQSRAVNVNTETIILGVPHGTVLPDIRLWKEVCAPVSFLKFTPSSGWCVVLGNENEPASLALPVDLELT